jgi:hypothetical protein
MIAERFQPLLILLGKKLVPTSDGENLWTSLRRKSR